MAATPFGATATNVRDLVQDVGVEGTRVGAARLPRIGNVVIERWMEEAAARVNLRVAGYEQALAGTPYVEQVETTGRHLVELYAAALLWDATHPERGGMGGGGTGTRLSDSLMARFGTVLEELAGFLDRVLGNDAAGDGDGSGVPGVTGRELGADAAFPRPMFSVRTGW